MKKEFVEKETEEQKQARWAKQMKQMKTFAKGALTREQRAAIKRERRINSDPKYYFDD